MRYYELNPKILRTHFCAYVMYRCDDLNTRHQEAVLSVNQPWGDIRDFDYPLDTSDCWEIPETKYIARLEQIARVTLQSNPLR
jgi:hypothetical protein